MFTATEKFHDDHPDESLTRALGDAGFDAAQVERIVVVLQAHCLRCFEFTGGGYCYCEHRS